MNRTTMFIFAVICSCGEPVDGNAPPVSAAGSPQVPVADATPPDVPDDDPCLSYETCAVECGVREFGDDDQTDAEQDWCLAMCDAPRSIAPETSWNWGWACMNGRGRLCMQGFELCMFAEGF